ncbi:MFS transporter [Streptomyces sp. NPDC005892]|uniref:MFS transporter n=1 Tax=Streptomyces sp. NPDC005892 TaxID=3155593 RepID=UPI0033F7B26E
MHPRPSRSPRRPSGCGRPSTAAPPWRPGSFCDEGWFPVTLPLFTPSVLHTGAAGFGAATAFMSAGAVLGGFMAVRGPRVTTRSLSVSGVLWGALICVAASAPTLPLAPAALVLVGSGSITFDSGAKTLLQVTAAPPTRGRVVSIWSIGWMGGTVVGAPLVGAIAAAAGPRSALLLGGLAAAAVGLVMLALPASRGGHDVAGPGGG